VIIIIDEDNLNLNRSERGEGKLLKNIFENISGFKSIFINMRNILSKIKFEEKIDFLISLGF